MPKSKIPNIDRSGRFMLYYQAEGVCLALRTAMQFGKLPGPATVELLKAMRLGARDIGSDSAFDRLPECQRTRRSPICSLLQR
jgi:hypothetical protein